MDEFLIWSHWYHASQINLISDGQENAQLLGVIKGNDKKTQLFPQRAVPDFTSKIGREIKDWKSLSPKEHGWGVDESQRTHFSGR